MVSALKPSTAQARPDASAPPPVLVLSAPALPAATLAAALGRNPSAYGLPEIALPLCATVDAFLREMSGPRVMQTHGLLRAICQLYAGEQTAHAVEMARRWLNRRDWMATEAVMAEIALRVAPLRMIMPVTAALFDGAAMKRIAACFPDATYLVVRAHPRVYGHVALNSEAGRVALQLSGSLDETYDPPLPDPQGLWLRSEEAIARHLAAVPPAQVHAVRAEALARSPKETLSALAGLLALPATDAALSDMLAPEASVYAGPGPLGAHSKMPIRSLAELAAEFPKREEETMEGPLQWRPDKAGFLPEVADKAAELGLA